MYPLLFKHSKLGSSRAQNVLIVYLETSMKLKHFEHRCWRAQNAAIRICMFVQRAQGLRPRTQNVVARC